MKKPYAKVAIITRTKNRNLLLKRAIESLRLQTFHDYVQVIVNDGGDQNSLDGVIRACGDDRLLMVNNEESVGLVRALNQGIASVDSQYISILDDDDTWAPDRLQRVTDFMDTHKSEATVVKMDVIIEEIEGDKIKKIDQYLHPDSGDGEISLFKQCFRNYLSNGVLTYSRHLYDKLGGYNESLQTAEDWDFGLRLLMTQDVETIRTDHPLFFYHQRPSQDGDQGNSVHAGVVQQERTINLLRNKYLRDDIKNGRLGVGYIMNQTVFDITNVVRLEGHINLVAGELSDSVISEIHKASTTQYVEGIKDKFRFRKNSDTK